MRRSLQEAHGGRESHGYRRARSVSHNRRHGSPRRAPRETRREALLGRARRRLAARRLRRTPRRCFRYAFLVAETGFDPAQISDLYSSNLIDNIFDTPLKYDYLARPLKLVPNTLAAMPEITEDGTLYTMQVKPGIYFADDRRVQGQEARAHRRRLRLLDQAHCSIRASSRPTSTSSRDYIAGMDEVARKRARKGGAHGLRRAGRGAARARPLHVPGAAHAAQLQLPLLPRLLQPHLRRGARGGASATASATSEHPVGTGPYRLAFWKRSSKMVFERNPSYREEYYDAHPAPDDARAPGGLRREQGQAPADGRPRRGLHHRGAAAALALVPERRARPDRAPARASSPTSAMPNGKVAPNLAQARHLPRPPAGHGAHLLVLHHGGPGGRRLYAGQGGAAPRDRRSATDIEEEIHIPRKNQAIAGAQPHRPRRGGLRPGFPLECDRLRPARKAKALLDMYGYVDCDGDGWRDLPRRKPGDPCKPLTIEYAAAPGQRHAGAGGALEAEHGRHRHPHDVPAREVARPPEGLEGRASCRCGGWAGAPPIPDADAFFVTLYGPNSGQANHARFQPAGVRPPLREGAAPARRPRAQRALPRDEPPLPRLLAVAPRRAPLSTTTSRSRGSSATGAIR